MKKTPSFEEKMAELEAILLQLESGNLPLNDLVSIHQRGKQLLADLDMELKTAEQKIETIQTTQQDQ